MYTSVLIIEVHFLESSNYPFTEYVQTIRSIYTLYNSIKGVLGHTYLAIKPYSLQEIN